MDIIVASDYYILMIRSAIRRSVTRVIEFIEANDRRLLVQSTEVNMNLTKLIKSYCYSQYSRTINKPFARPIA